MGKMTWAFTRLMVFLMAAGLFMGCGKSRPAGGKAKTIKYPEKGSPMPAVEVYPESGETLDPNRSMAQSNMGQIPIGDDPETRLRLHRERIEQQTRRNEAQLFQRLQAQAAKDPSSLRGMSHNIRWIDIAIGLGSRRCLRILIDNGVDLEETNSTGYTPLMMALEGKQIIIARFLIEEGKVDVNHKADDLNHPISFAVGLGDPGLVELMLAKGAVLHPAGTQYHHLHLAVSRNNLKIAQLLLDHGEDANETDHEGRTALYRARASNQDEMAQFLESRGAKLTPEEIELLKSPLPNPFMDAACGVEKIAAYRYRDKVREIRKAMQEGRQVDQEQFMGMGARESIEIIKKQYLEELDQLARTQPELIDQPGEDGKTPLLKAIDCESYMIDFFLDHGADVNRQDAIGITALLAAIYSSATNETTARKIIAHGADVRIADNKGTTALHLATSNDQLELMETLIGKGAGVNAADKQGFTPIHCTIRGGGGWISLPAIKLLIKHGADINARNNKSGAILHDAAYYGDLDAVKYLVEHGAKVNLKGWQGNTPLHMAAIHRKEEVMKYLISHGADPNALNDESLTPAQAAEKKKNR